jgi:uncharacterized protein (TIGR02757 family)
MQKRTKLDDALYKLLEEELKKRDCIQELCDEQRPDPLMVAKKYNQEDIALICALFSYGNAKAIVKFLNTLDFSLLKQDDKDIEQKLQNHYYRFQSSQDIIELFKTVKHLESKKSIEEIFKIGYKKQNSVMDGLGSLLSFMYDSNSYRSKGYEFLLGKIPTCKATTTYKRWHMYLRWMIRRDNLDLGLWHDIDTRDLLLPLDTHTFKVGQKLGLIRRKTYDFKAVLEITNALKRYDCHDPVKYDFALYRIGQEKLLDLLIKRLN